MLIDIFARRYEAHQLRDTFESRDGRLLQQAFRILKEDVSPYYYSDGKENPSSVSFWSSLQSGLSRELGLSELSPKWLSYTTQYNGGPRTQTFEQTWLTVCEKWMTLAVSGSPDEFIKERLSLVELGFRKKEEEVAAMLAQPITEADRLLASLSPLRLPGDFKEGIRARRQSTYDAFRSAVEELNTRFRQNRYPLHYHNGFIQIATDDLVQKEVETPFWSLVDGPIWRNVDRDMKEALDLRDSDGKDPAFFAARALESTIKIISERKGWTRGKERGAHAFIDNLVSKANGFILPWEATSLKEFFTHVRNPLGHGAGSAEMPTLDRARTEWVIEFCMSWIKSLVRRSDWH